MPKKAHFSPAFFEFLADLAVNNNREWFTENKPRYEAEVKAPLIEFIKDFGPRLEKISPHFVADPRGNGGSMFRIYRDTRFSKDKTPYKTHAAAQFRHAQGKDVHAPGFYLHLEPGSVFMGCGIWRPESAPLRQIRTRIAEEPGEWKKVIGKKAFKEQLTLGGDSLTRPPKGFDADHPYIEDIKRKSFIVSAEMSVKAACEADFLTQFTKVCKTASGFMAFISGALEVPY